MIVTCPACRTRFQLAPASLGDAGRNVRCSSCGERWFVEPFVAAPPTPPTLPEPKLQSERARSAALRSPRLAHWLMAALVVLLTAAAITGRNQIAARLPAAASVYQRLGLSLELPLGMEFRELSSARKLSQGKPVLVVTGKIANITSQRRDVPPLRVALLDADRRELEHGLFDPPQKALGPGGAARFEVELGTPPAEASDFSVTFGVEP